MVLASKVAGLSQTNQECTGRLKILAKFCSELTTVSLKAFPALVAGVLVLFSLVAACGGSESVATTETAATREPPSAPATELAIQEQASVPSALFATKSATANANRKVGGAVGNLAPEFGGIEAWINGGPLTMEELRGSVVLVDFWTYTCINCIHTYPFLKEMHAKYADDGLVIVGVHSPEFEFEKNYDSVVEATQKDALVWTMAQDNDFITWRRYNNRYWPAEYLIDKDGVVRYTHFGEGAYAETEDVIRELLAESGSPRGS